MLETDNVQYSQYVDKEGRVKIHTWDDVGIERLDFVFGERQLG